MTKGLTVHTIVKNEDMWVWFAIQSVLPFADKILIFDTGSTDKTVEMVKTINSPKIIFEEKGVVDKTGLTMLRQEQIDGTDTEWFLILDGDEIWPLGELEKLINQSKGATDNIAAIFNRTKNCVGDIYHYLPETAGHYSIAGIKGNLNMRLIRKTPKLRVTGEYPLESFIDESGALTEQDQNLLFCDCWYLHTSFLQRSSTDKDKISGSFNKRKIWEKGITLKKEELPEVFNLPRPEIVTGSFAQRGMLYETAAFLTTPLINLKRVLK